MKKVLIISILIILVILSCFVIHKINLNNYNYLSRHISFIEDESICSGCYRVEKSSDIDINNKYYKKIIDEQINEVLKQEIDFDNTIFIYNPYGNNKNLMYIYFVTEKSVSVRYTSEVDGVKNTKLLYENIDNKSLDLYNYKIDDLSFGKKNKVIIELLDLNNKVVDKNTREVNLTNIK